MGVLNALRKGAAAGAAAAVPMLMEEHRAQITAQRDAKLRSYDEQDQAANRDHQTKEREAGQKFTTEENDRNRALTREQNQAERDQRAAEFDTSTGIQRENLELDRERLDLQVRQADQVLAAGELEIAEKKKLQELRNAVIDESATDEQLQAASQRLDAYMNENRDRFAPLYVDQVDETGYPTGGRDTFILNTGTGETRTPQAGALSRRTGNPSMSGLPAQPQTQEEYDALPPGALFIDPEDGKTYQKQ